MPQSFARIYIHLIFSTKSRTPDLLDTFREPLHAYMAGSLQQIQCAPILINSVEDHVHLLFEWSRTVSVSQSVGEVKTSSNKWIKRNTTGNDSFEWQGGYGAFSVSASQLNLVRNYIAGQREHHRHISFQDEMRAFFKKHGIEFDERYIWD